MQTMSLFFLLAMMVFSLAMLVFGICLAIIYVTTYMAEFFLYVLDRINEVFG